MYKFDKNHQFGLADFNQPMGLKMNPENRWVKKAETIPWEAIEEKYAALFPSKKGMPAKPLRTALDTTTRSSIALSIIAMNVNRLTVVSFAQILVSMFLRCKRVYCTAKIMHNKSYKDLEIC